MKLIRPPKLELYAFLFSMPMIAAIVNLILYEGRLWTDYRIWVYSMPLIYVIGIVSWYGHVLYAHWIEQKYPESHQSKERVTMKALVVLLIMSPSVLLIVFIYRYFQILGYQYENQHLVKALVVGVCVNLIFETLFEADFIFSKMKESALEKETMAELAIHQDFVTLKNQVNPHFLFNCFNTLSSLISIDRQRAERFLNELSKVYRYLLKNNEEGVSTVDSEIRFIESYYNLLRTRHGEAIQLNLQVDKRYESYLLPSLSLQLLVENAVKHNAFSKKEPLVVEVFTTAGNNLVVNNNVQRLLKKASGSGIGLQNIKAKYILLKKTGFQILQDDRNFTVVLPLIWDPNRAKA